MSTLPKSKGSSFQNSLAKLTADKVADVRAYWMRKNANEYEIYDFEKGSLVVNESALSVRFILRPNPINIHQYDPFQVVIREHEGRLSFKSPVYEDPTQDYPLRMFSSANELLFVCSFGNEQTYFHIFLNQGRQIQS